MKRNTVYIFILFFSLASFSQEKKSFEKIDTLEVLLRTSEKLRVANDMYSSLEYAFKAVNYAQNLENYHYLSHGYLLMGTVQYEIIDYENATKNFLKSLEYTEKTKDKILLPYILHSLGNIYYDDNNDYENALKYYKRAVELGKENPHIQQYQIPLHNLIWTYMDLDRFDEASTYLREADSIDRTIPDSVQIDRSSLYLLRARNYAHNNNIEKAEKNFEKSFDYLKDETYWPKGKSYFYQYRSEMYENIGDYTKAINDLKMLNENDRKVFENARAKTDKTTKIRFKVDQYEQKLAIAKREKALLLDIDKNNKMIISISSMALLLLAGVVFFYYRGYQSKKKISEILEVKNAELSEAKSQAEQLSKIKSQFISTISHELRTPLYGVVGISSILLENDAKSQKDKKLLNSLKFSADYLLDLVNKVLKVSKIDSEEKELIKTPTDLFSLSQNIIQSFEYQSHKKNNVLILDHNHSIPKLLYVDALRISEVLINLIGNAIKFTEKGKIWLRIKLLSTNTKTALIRFEIEDTGTGIPESQKEFIFEEFSQVGSVYDNKQGTGLGLSIVKNLVQVMGSQIHFESKKDIGSIFYFDLELDVAESLNDLSSDTENKENATNISAKILVAEDNKINQLVTKNLLKNIGCTCTMVENGIDAVQTLRKESFDLILMDINMPVMDGVQATLEIRVFDTTTPIIALTASELSEVSDECKKAGMNDLINKPLNKEDLRNCIIKHYK
ncbi:Signal transduction histidine kinase [Aquimarina amphilecti]|uniref:histidine kinase n=1 Tax=Aquimarina amphilecti TaxID=1038014 RepID=A0A1H7VER5_AQUAM|nr:response regulator [Aquimarina amphilecti]SEM07736.1 Signal transduction histidine kinase [Aquimarina amphilecti]